MLTSIQVLWNCGFLLCQISITSWFWPLGLNKFKFSLRFFKMDFTFQDQLTTYSLPYLTTYLPTCSSTVFERLICLIHDEYWKDVISFKKFKFVPPVFIFESLTKKAPLDAYYFHSIFLCNIFQATETNLQRWDLIIVLKLLVLNVAITGKEKCYANIGNWLIFVMVIHCVFSRCIVFR